MSDNATLPATGTVVRAIDKAGTVTQVTAIDIGGAGTESLLSAANPLPITVSSALPVSAASLPLPAGASTEATLAAVQTLLNTIAGSIENHNSPFVDGSAGQIMLAKRRDADTTAVADGDLNVLNQDEEGRLKVSTKPASYATVTGDISAVAGTVSIDCQRLSGIALQVHGTFAAMNCTFEVSNNSTNGTDGNWGLIQGARSNANTAETATGNLSASPAYLWEVSVNPYKWFRVRCTARTSGTQTWTLVPGSYATEVTPVVQVTSTQPVSGTVTATVTAGTVNPVVPATPYFVNSAATTNGALVLTGTSNLSSFYATNEGASVAYVKLYNKATAPTVGTDIPEMIIPVPAAASGVPGVANPNIGFHGFRFALGMGIAITRNAVYTDTTAVGASEVKVKLSRTV